MYTLARKLVHSKVYTNGKALSVVFDVFVSTAEDTDTLMDSTNCFQFVHNKDNTKLKNPVLPINSNILYTDIRDT